MSDKSFENLNAEAVEVAEVAAGASVVIGRVETLNGLVEIVRADGERVMLGLGDPVYQGDVIVTGSDGGVGIVFLDQTLLSIAENGKAVLDEVIYDSSEQAGSMALSLLQGVFSMVSGEIAKTDPDALVLTTPVATIGIRGTQVSIDVGEGDKLQVLLMEESDGTIGEVIVANAEGIKVLNQPLQGVMVTSGGAAPSDVYTVDVETALNTYGNALIGLPTSVGNANRYEAGLDDFNTDAGIKEINTEAGGQDTGEDSGIPHIDVTGDEEEISEPEAAAPAPDLSGAGGTAEVDQTEAVASADAAEERVDEPVAEGVEPEPEPEPEP
ncbi:MAG: FecR domain-containing protein, partial [Rhodospirillaceae bacterium]|nr:FecR domain-containing protein [Rhodospirillaceae bacterium]